MSKSKRSVTKAVSSDQNTTVPSTKEQGNSGLVSSGHFLKNQRSKELVMPNRICTFTNMLQNPAIGASITHTNLPVIKSLYEGKVKPGSSKIKSQEAADLIEHALKNIEGGWLEHINTAISANTMGFSLFNYVLYRETVGKYKGKFLIKKLAHREQSSVYGWVYDDSTDDYVGFVQKNLATNRLVRDNASAFEYRMGSNRLFENWGSFGTFVPKENTVHYRINPTFGNPEGASPLLICFNPYMEMEMVSELEVIGVGKDISGVTVLRVPKEMLAIAANPENQKSTQVEKQIQELQSKVVDMNDGRQSMLMLTSDPISATSNFREFEVESLNQAQRQVNTTEIIDQKRKEIYNIFGTGFMLLGQSGSGGSFAMASETRTTFDSYVESRITEYAEVINTQIIPQLLAANEIYLSQSDMPKFIPENNKELDLDTLGKFVQRLKSTGSLTEGLYEQVLDRANLKPEGIDELDYKDKGDSRAGEGDGTSGTGTAISGTDDSNLNLENKSFLLDSEDENKIVITDEKGNFYEIDKNG